MGYILPYVIMCECLVQLYLVLCRHYESRRQGLSENAWVNVRSDLLAALQLHRAALNVPHIQISHLITYHRYLFVNVLSISGTKFN